MNDAISRFISERIAANDFPSAVYLVAEKGEIVYTDALGLAVVEPERIEANLDTIYDVASLTKVLVTGLLYAIERDRGFLTGDPVGYCRDLSHYGKGSLTFEQFFSHTTGFKAWEPLYLADTRPARFILQIPFEGAPGERVIYSDLNFIALGMIYERAVGSLDSGFRTVVAEPLSLARTMFNPPESLKRQIAASEKGNEYERRTCIEMGYHLPGGNASVNERGDQVQPARQQGHDIQAEGYALADARASALRSYQIWGEVHDGNAWFMGGVAGHAGLFSTAEEVFRIALQFLPNYTQLLKPETCELFRTNFTKGLNEDRSFAFQLASTEGSTAGTKMSPESFGHNGFTGTSLWIDPIKERIFVLLTNRTHNHPLPFVNINSVRRRFHDLAIEALDDR